jgi:cytoskeleton protein RodZ
VSPPSAAPVVATTAPGPTQARTEAVADSTLVLTFVGTSWVRVKDESGAVLVAQTGTAGATLPVGGRPPLDVVIGNADKVRAQFRGQPVDLAPHTRFNVARLVLQ